MATRDKTREKLEKAALRASQKSIERQKKNVKKKPKTPEFRLGNLVGSTCLIDLEAETKDDLLRNLAETVALEKDYPSAEQIFRSSLERESVVNTYLGNGVAVPHARVSSFEGFCIAVARNSNGLPYTVETDEPVQLVIFLVGNEQDNNMHVQLLAAIASVVNAPGVREAILQATSITQVKKVLNDGAKSKRRRPRQLTKLLLSHSRKIARDIGATAVLVALEHSEELTILKRLPKKESFIVATRSGRIAEAAEKVVKRVIRLPNTQLNRETLVRVGTLMGVAEGFIAKDDVVAFLSGQTEDGLDTFSVLSVSREFGRFLTTSGEISPLMTPGLFERVLTLASELAREGREGKPIGTIFVIGDPEQLEPFSQQLVINPFKGYPDEEKNIMDPTLKETIKEFATIDGAFILDWEGVIHSAGTYLQPGEFENDLPSGYGTRHRVAAGISKAVDCVSIAISESTGKVMFFKNGETIFSVGKTETI